MNINSEHLGAKYSVHCTLFTVHISKYTWTSYAYIFVKVETQLFLPKPMADAFDAIAGEVLHNIKHMYNIQDQSSQLDLQYHSIPVMNYCKIFLTCVVLESIISIIIFIIIIYIILYLISS